MPETLPPAPKVYTDFDRKSAIDRFGDLYPVVKAEAVRVAAFKANFKDDYDALSKLISDFYEASPADKEYTARGDRHTVKVFSKKKEREIVSMSKLKNWLGLKTFLANCGFPLGAVDELVPASAHELFLHEGKTGRRPVVLVEDPGEGTGAE